MVLVENALSALKKTLSETKNI